MVIYSYLQKNHLLRANFLRTVRAFTLLEVVLVLFVLAILAGALAPAANSLIERGQLEAENRTLAELASTIKQSFEATDLTNINIAALPGTIGPADVTTEFSTSVGTPYTTTDNSVWFAKVARLRGLAPVVGDPPTAAYQPALSRIAFNAFGNPRLLIAAPAEANEQRFLLLSLMARSDQLYLPYYDGSEAWFDAIWSTDWENPNNPLPIYWYSAMSFQGILAWYSRGPSRPNLAPRLCVQRIVLPKYTVTVNDNHPTNNAYVSFNDVADAFMAAANSGTNTTPAILGGRLVTINQGTSLPGVQALQFHLHENATVTIQ